LLPVPGRRRESISKTMTNIRISESESLHANGRPCRVNGAQLGLQEALPGAMPGETVGVGHVGGIVMKRRVARQPI